MEQSCTDLSPVEVEAIKKKKPPSNCQGTKRVFIPALRLESNV